MKKGIVIILISIFIQSIVAENFQPFVPTSYSRLWIEGATDSFNSSVDRMPCYNNIYELQVEDDAIVTNKLKLNLRYELSTEKNDCDYKVYAYNSLMLNNKVGEKEFDMDTYLWGGYTRYFPLLNNFPLSVALNFSHIDFSYNSNGSNRISLKPEISLGIGRVYSISDVTVVNILFDALGIPKTEEKIKAVTKILDKEDKIKNDYDFKSLPPASYNYLLDYYQSIADALGIPDRLDELLTVINWSYMRNASYRNSYVNLSKGIRLKIYADKEIEYKFNYPTPTDNGLSDSFIYYGANVYGSGEIIKNKLFGDLTLGTFFNIDSTGIQHPIVSGTTKLVYFPNLTNLLFEIAAKGYYNINTTDYAYDASASVHYILDREIVLYTGVQYLDETASIADYGVFVGGKVALY